eukprot:Nitzschia sp. Nitz4//scaffold403_size10707//5645//7207//NITZ4_009063-RA/size10707-processed-gene-0.2-mRNA-1//1//CDS//3329551086//3258//frame0
MLRSRVAAAGAARNASVASNNGAGSRFTRRGSPLRRPTNQLALGVAALVFCFLAWPQLNLSASLTAATGTSKPVLPPAVAAVVERAKKFQQTCHDEQKGKDVQAEDPFAKADNEEFPPLPAFGFLHFIEKYLDGSTPASSDAANYPYQCVAPPATECGETKFTVVFMAYNPDRLHKVMKTIREMTDPNQDYHKMVHEILIVWNGERSLQESDLGQHLVQRTQDPPQPNIPTVRISYPLKAGFPNDLFNRYHPRLNVATKAIMYYDDDGPFYEYAAVLAGFELWKRNSNAQMGAMARRLDPLTRKPRHPTDFSPHCPSDLLDYNFHIFANVGANMVLPSGSFLHSNYLACLWHPAFQELRDYILAHPTHPDDATVSTIVSQLSGRAPLVYSRRLQGFLENKEGDTEQNGGRRRLEALQQPTNRTATAMEDMQLPPDHRRLMDGINWDAGGNHDLKMVWGNKRSNVANSLTRYFGSINPGSLGWCHDTPWYKAEANECDPVMAHRGTLPWMTPENLPKDTCP